MAFASSLGVRRQLDLLELLVSASLRNPDPALGRWVGERVEAHLVEPSRCRARVTLRCKACGAHQEQEFDCGPDCPHCQVLASRRVRMAKRIGALMPAVPGRHLVLSLPLALRRCLADGTLRAAALQKRFEATLFERIQARVRAAQPGLRASELSCGAVSVLHRFDRALRFSPHLHAFVLDGVFVRDESSARFVPCEPPLEAADLEAVAAQIERGLTADRELRSELAQPIRELRKRSAEAPAPPPRPAGPESAAAQAGGVRVFVSPPIAGDDHVARRRILEYLGRGPLDEASVEEVGVNRIRTAHAGEVAPEELALRLAAVSSPDGPGALRQHGIMVERSARSWGLRPRQLSLPATESAARPEPKPVPSSPSARTPRAAPACDICGGELETEVVEEIT